MVQNPFRPTNRRNPCPCCGDTKHRCKSKKTEFTLPDGYINDVQYFCMSYQGDLAGFKYCGETTNYIWGKYITQILSDELSDSWKEYHNQNRQAKRKRFSSFPSQRVRQVKTKSYQNLLPIEQRHDQISSLLKQLKLSKKHYQALIQRGFNNQEIEYYQFKSIRYLQPLAIPISDRLAGIAPGGFSLSNKYSGLLIPISNHHQQFQGWQTRLDFSLDYRYLWPKTKETSVHVREYEELPLSFTLPMNQINSEYIGIVEGIGFKAIHTANRFDQIVLGASSGMFASSPRQLHEFLIRAREISGDNRVLLYPDAGAVRNRLVLIQYQKTAALILKYNFELSVAWWEQITKTQADIDEYQGSMEIISLQEFFAIAKKFVNKKPPKIKLS